MLLDLAGLIYGGEPAPVSTPVADIGIAAGFRYLGDRRRPVAVPVVSGAGVLTLPALQAQGHGRVTLSAARARADALVLDALLLEDDVLLMEALDEDDRRVRRERKKR